MAKFSGTKTPPRRPAGPVTTTGPTATHEGGAGHALDVKSELFTLAVTNMVNEATFYESADKRDERYASLVRSATIADPDWTTGLIGWLRSEGLMRSASVVAACEYVAAGGPHGRRVIDAACQRADEPGEILGYWLAVHGRPIPKPIKRGLGDAARRLYNERALLKYDTPSHGVRFGDVIDLAHVRPRGNWQSTLFRYALERRHNRPDGVPEALVTIAAAKRLDGMSAEARREELATRGSEALSEAGYTWERLAGTGQMDAAAWELAIPQMGYMATLRNLRNFEQARISSTARAAVTARLTDPEQVARSRQFPFRFWTAFRELDAVGSFTYLAALEQALDLATRNIPELTGRTLVMIDTSASMSDQMSAKSTVGRAEAAAVFGAALAKRNDAEVWAYADRTYRLDTMQSIQGTARQVVKEIGRVGHGTQTWPSVAHAMRKAQAEGKPFTRVCVFSDMQDHLHAWYGGEQPPTGLPVYVWDLAGYGRANVSTSTSGHYVLGGLSDATFKLMPLLEAGTAAAWPWEIEAG